MFDLWLFPLQKHMDQSILLPDNLPNLCNKIFHGNLDLSHNKYNHMKYQLFLIEDLTSSVYLVEYFQEIEQNYLDQSLLIIHKNQKNHHYQCRYQKGLYKRHITHQNHLKDQHPGHKIVMLNYLQDLK